MRWRHWAKGSVLPIAHGVGLFSLLRAMDAGHRRVALNYHNVDPGLFRRHVDLLATLARVVSLESLLDGPGRGGVEVALTFDDGYRTFVDEILPTLVERGLPATWFVPTAHVGTDDIFWFDRVRAAVLHARTRGGLVVAGHEWALFDWNREYVAAGITRILKAMPVHERNGTVDDLLREIGAAPEVVLRRLVSATREQLRALPALITVGSHSDTHPQLSQLDEASLRQELSLSRSHLEQWTDRAVRHFAYPSGDFDERVVNMVRATGYESAWTTEPRFIAVEDRYRMPRVAIDDHAPLSVLSAKLTFWVNRLPVIRA